MNPLFIHIFNEQTSSADPKNLPQSLFSDLIVVASCFDCRNLIWIDHKKQLGGTHEQACLLNFLLFYTLVSKFFLRKFKNQEWTTQTKQKNSSKIQKKKCDMVSENIESS